MSERTYEKLMESRLAKLRAGKGAGTIEEFIDDPDIRVVLVPLTDGEWLKALEIADTLDVGNNPAGVAARDEMQKTAMILFSAREVRDWEIPFFNDISEVSALPDHEINHLYDCYLEMVAVNSPALTLLDEEQWETLKKVWQQIEWSELSGQQLYAANRFLVSIQEKLLQASLSGSR